MREEAGEEWLNDGSEDDLGTTGLGKGHPQDEDEFEHIVESCRRLAIGCIGVFMPRTEPVDSIDQALNDVQECIDNPILLAASTLSVCLVNHFGREALTVNH